MIGINRNDGHILQYFVALVVVVRATNPTNDLQGLLSVIALSGIGDVAPIDKCWKPSLKLSPGLHPCQSMAQDDGLRKHVAYEVARCLKEDAKRSIFEPIRRHGTLCTQSDNEFNLQFCVQEMTMDELMIYQRSYLMLFRSCSEISTKQVDAREAKVKDMEIVAFKRKSEVMEAKVDHIQRELELLEKDANDLLSEKERLRAKNDELRYASSELYNIIQSSKDEFEKSVEVLKVIYLSCF